MVLLTKQTWNTWWSSSISTDSTLSGIGTPSNPLTLKTNRITLATLRTEKPTLYDIQATYKVYEYTYWTTKYYRKVMNDYSPITDIFYWEPELKTVIASRALSI